MTTKVPGVWCRMGLSPRGPHQWRVLNKPGPVRCDLCGRRLQAQVVYDCCNPNEVRGYRLPPHKTKERTLQRPKGDRRGRMARKG
jgi:hypothetical protein